MINVRIEVAEDDHVYEEFEKEFSDEQEMRDWLLRQNEHPWLSVRVVSKDQMTQ